MRLLLICPGRGSYGPDQLGSLQGPCTVLDRLDALRAAAGHPTLRELDAAPRYSAAKHLAGEHASLLTFGATLSDVAQLDPARARICAIGGNSMGWYTALTAAGVLTLDQGARLVETLAWYQHRNVQGGQVLYPVVDAQWRPDAALRAQVEAALATPGVHLSIRLGGTAVLAAQDLAPLQALPPVTQGRTTYPRKLAMHSAFHTPVMADTAQRASADLADLAFGAPDVPMVDGDGRVWQTWSDPAALKQWTLGPQIVDTYDFTATIQAAMGQYAPDAILLPGPGGTLGAPIAQALIECGWRGLRDRQDFADAQSGDTPVVISMARPEQRALVCATD